MGSAAPVPFISVENVQSALDSLGYASAPTAANPLERLMLVEQAVMDPSVPPSALARELILGQLLVGAIEDQLALQRTAHNLMPPDDTVTRTGAFDLLRADSATGSHALIGWSILFHRYVCVTLDLTPEHLAEALSVDVRSVRRYQARAVRHLTKWLTDAEQSARTVQKRRRLIAALPTQVPANVIGQRAMWETLNRLHSDQRPFHVFVSGPHGIGKTTLVQEYVRALIDGGFVDQLIWLERPVSVEQVRLVVAERLIPEDAPTSVREMLQVVSAVIVLDGADRIVTEPDFTELMNEWSAAAVFVIGSAYVPPVSAHAHLTVPPLNERETIELTQAVLAGSDEPPDTVEAFGRALWQTVGGNPQLVKVVAANSQFAQTLGPTAAHALDQIYADAIRALSDDELRVLMMAALTPPGELSTAQLKLLWPSPPHDTALDYLVRASWLERTSRDDNVFRIVNTTRQYLYHLAAREEPVRTLIGSLLDELETAAMSAVLRGVLLHLLAQDDVAFPDGWRSRTLSRLAPVDMSSAQRPYWRSILENERVKQGGPLDAPLEIAYTVTLRRASEWPTAMTLLADVVRRTGMSGDFLVQARAMLELAVLYRLSGEYENARSLLAKAEKTGRRFHDELLVDRAPIELAQCHVAAGDGAVALTLLTGLPNSLRVFALRAEALFLQGDAARAAQQMALAFAVPDVDTVTLARLHSVLGRGYEAQGQLDQARDRFTTAVSLLEQSDDPFALARAQSNLAAVRIRLGLLNGTAELLRRAEGVQRLLGDRVGLTATRHNQRLLTIRSSR